MISASRGNRTAGGTGWNPGGESANTAEAYIYSRDEARELALTWGSGYGDLEPGHYRVTKWFFEYRGPGDTTDFLLTAEFTME